MKHTLTLLTALLLAPLAAIHAADSPIDRHSLFVYDDFGDAQAEKPRSIPPGQCGAP